MHTNKESTNGVKIKCISDKLWGLEEVLSAHSRLISCPRLKQTNVCAGDRRVNSMEIYELTCITTINLTSNSVSDSGSPNSPPFEPSSVSASIVSEFSDGLRLELGIAGFSRRT